jgi:hypothetical protein
MVQIHVFLQICCTGSVKQNVRLEYHYLRNILRIEMFLCSTNEVPDMLELCARVYGAV